ncbi:GNAT family N-acetyltransferase [Nocardia sp. NPDC052566]|uniref:GNAT family N-acetyltransferase n=1 Tax=Nocardia sp. NPDC052566 TaxID=3364330 RepID=UPI0037C55B74
MEFDITTDNVPAAADLSFRASAEDDHPRVLEVLGRWWGGLGGDEGARQRASLLPRLFFQHFNDTSFIVERDGELVGFLVGFLSQSHPDEAYIHFVGIAPELQGHGLGRTLYEKFFDLVRRHNRTTVRAITSPANTGSQSFHAQMGFTATLSPHPHYDGPDLTRVTFVRTL